MDCDPLGLELMSPALRLAGNEGHLADISRQERTAHLWAQLHSSGCAGGEGRSWIVASCRRWRVGRDRSSCPPSCCRQRCKQPQLCLGKTAMGQERNQLCHERCCAGLCLRRQKPLADQEMPAGILLSAEVKLMCLERKRLWKTSERPSSSCRGLIKEGEPFCAGAGRGRTRGN